MPQELSIRKSYSRSEQAVIMCVGLLYCAPVQIRDLNEDTRRWDTGISLGEKGVRTLKVRTDVQIGKIMMH
jgi:hypothetical protein